MIQYRGMKKTLKWFVTSSTNPEKISLTIKGIVAFAILVGLDEAVVNEFGNNLANFILGLGILASAGLGIWGAIRKIVIGRWSAFAG
ncbi:MAG: hypothetical protein DDT19_01189 [Syntrophomonadaceae bacterium]|nr:hypothetical protein [Bacillota bacterium]